MATNFEPTARRTLGGTGLPAIPDAVWSELKAEGLLAAEVPTPA
jgi:hypothetical protein